jgi:signal transduction histidine kinase
MKQDEDKSRDELIEDVEKLRVRVVELETANSRLQALERSLRENERLLDDVFNSIQDGISVLNSDMEICRVNRIMNRWYAANTPLEGKKCFQCYHNFNKPCEPCPTIRCFQSGRTEYDIVPGLPGTPVKWLELFCFPIKDIESGEVSGVVEFVRDITQRRMAELELQNAYQELEQRVDKRTKELLEANVSLKQEIAERQQMQRDRETLTEQLRHAQKMESIGVLAGGIAHDFNNILGVIIGYSELIGDDIPEDTIARQNLQQVLSAAHRAKDLVKQILAFSRKSKEERKPLFISRFLKEDLKLLKSTLPSTIQIQMKIAENLGPLMTSVSEIHQLIMNLCTNAAHAMRENVGILNITLTEVYLDRIAIGRKTLKPGKYQRLVISDNGHGIPSELKARIFEPYFTTKKPGEGTGMGLAVVHGIVKSHDGDISIYSEPGQGTTFHVFLPVTSLAGKPADAPIQSPRGGNEQILYVDDEQNLVDVGEKMLTKLGYHVEVRTDSREALETFQQNPHRFDLLITDQTMPSLTGMELTRRVKELRPDLPVILCSGFSEGVNEEDLQSRGIDAFVMKPVIRSEIARVIRSVLDRE